MKVAIVHDWLYGGGAEKVVEELHRLYPEAPIFTSYCSDEWRKRLDAMVITGYLQNWPFSALRKFLPLLRQWWFSRLDLSAYDVVISSCGNGEARFARATKKGALHISYTHTPTHFYYRKYDQYMKDPGFRPKWLVRLALGLLVHPLRARDKRASQKVDYFIANSTHIAKDIQTYYGRESVVIHPPVDIERFEKIRKKTSDEPRYVMWGRHVPYKRFDLAIRACNTLKRKLVVIGDGPDTAFLKSIAGPTVKFVGRVSDDQLDDIASSASAFIAPMEEDFGIAPVEAMAVGLPVVAYASGGALDYVVDGKTGVFFDKQEVENVINAINACEAKHFSVPSIKAKAKEFSSESFRIKMEDYVTKLVRGV